jgi:hypothetical protein
MGLIGPFSDLPEDTQTNESAKFELDPSGYVRLRTSATGTFTQHGLNTGGLVTEVTINNTTWTALPATPLASRNAICVQNLSGQEIKINYSSSISGYVGVVVANGLERSYDITGAIVLYAKSKTSSCTVNVEEIA